MTGGQRRVVIVGSGPTGATYARRLLERTPDVSVLMVEAGPALTDRREWVCEVPDGTARIPCGGTHVTGLAELGTVRVGLVLDDEGQRLVMRTTTDG